jgi:SHS family lactate transporter-like MFS transporter
MNKAPNPFKLLALLNFQQWMFFCVAFFAWSWDAFDFFTVSLTVSDLAKDFGKTTKDITWGITLVLMLRSVGSIIFGLAADRWGRKVSYHIHSLDRLLLTEWQWPFVVNNLLFIVLELGTGFSQTYNQFLACRALFGIAMGGLYGNAAGKKYLLPKQQLCWFEIATALEDCPEAARGLISGMLQQGYAFGYLLATAFARGLVDTTSHGWRPVCFVRLSPKANC